MAVEVSFQGEVSVLERWYNVTSELPELERNDRQSKRRRLAVAVFIANVLRTGDLVVSTSEVVHLLCKL